MSKRRSRKVSKGAQSVGMGWHFHFLRPPTHVGSTEDAAAYLNEDVYDLGFLAESLARGGADQGLLALLLEDMHGVSRCMSEVLSGARMPAMETPTLDGDAFRLLVREAARIEVDDADSACLVRVLGRAASALREVA